MSKPNTAPSATTTDEAIAREPNRGRDAQAPWHIPLAGWRDIAVRLRHEVVADQITSMAAAITYYSLSCAMS